MHKSITLFKISFLTFTFWLFTFTVSLAQENMVTKIDPIQTTNSNSPNSPQSEQGDVKITDGINTLIRITDEGAFGAIEINPGVPDISTNKLYNKNGVLSFDGSPINSSVDNDWTVSGNNMYSKPTGNVGIGISNPTEKLEVTGKTKTSELQVTTGATDGHVLTSDVDGNATWQAPGGTGLNLSIGDTYQGGIIFWLDGSGEHGLIAAPDDEIDDLAWSTSSNLGGTAYARGIYSGEINSKFLGNPSFPAIWRCLNKNLNGYDDWYLPSIDELIAMMANLHMDGLGNFSYSSIYWSSTLTDNTQVYYITTEASLQIPIFLIGLNGSGGSSRAFKVRSIRKF